MSEAIKTKAQDTHTTICSAAKNLLANAGDVGDVGSIPHLGQEDPLEEERATHSSILAWKILCPWGHRAGHDLAAKQQQQIYKRDNQQDPTV